MFEDRGGWGVAFAMLAAASIVTVYLLFPEFMPFHIVSNGRVHSGWLGVKQADQTANATALAFASALAYLVLDRQRLHRRATKIIRQSNNYATYAQLRSSVEFSNGTPSPEEYAILWLLALAGNNDARSVILKLSVHQIDCPYVEKFRIRILRLFLINQIDRKFLFIVICFLAAWQISVTIVSLHWNYVPNLAHVVWLAVLFITLGMGIPAASWIFSEFLFDQVQTLLNELHVRAARARANEIADEPLPLGPEMTNPAVQRIMVLPIETWDDHFQSFRLAQGILGWIRLRLLGWWPLSQW